MRYLIPLCIALLFLPITIASAQEISASCNENLLNQNYYKKNSLTSYEFILPGKDDWVFRSNTDFQSNFSFHPAAVTALKYFQDLLNKNGITLVIAYPPTRGLTAHENIPQETQDKFNFTPEKAIKNYQSIFDPLQSDRIHVVGAPDFNKNEGFSRKKDQHWNTNGARQMAQNLARYIKSLPVYDVLTKQEFTTSFKKKYEFAGRYNEVTEKICGLTLAPEQDKMYETSANANPQNEDDLFGNKYPEVVLIGTSNSKADRFNVNFDGFLKEYLSADVLNHAEPGMGIKDPFLKYLTSQEFRKTPPKLIIWEIPSYYAMTSKSDALFHELEAAFHGECSEENTIKQSTTKIEKPSKQTLIEFNENHPNAKDSYIWLSFDHPFFKRFSIETTFNDDEKSTKGFRFERTRNFKPDGKFYTSYPKSDYSIKKIDINISEKLIGNTVKIKLCRKPAI